MVQTRLNEELKQFAELTNYGAEEKELQKYIIKVKEHLGIDNSILLP